jgi:hypothetical protein
MKPKTEKIFATLVRGKVYVLVDRNGGKDLTFLQGEPQEVTTAQCDHLTLHAVDTIAVRDHWATGETQGPGDMIGRDVQKFTFTTERAIAA